MSKINLIKEGEAEIAVVSVVKTLKSLAPEAREFDDAYKIFQAQKRKFFAWKESGLAPSNILLTVTDNFLKEYCSYSSPIVDLVRFPKLGKRSIIRVWQCNNKNERDFLLFEYPFLNRRIDKVYKTITSDFSIGLNFKQLDDFDNFQLQFTSGNPKHVRREVLRLFNSDLETILNKETTTRKESWNTLKQCSSAIWLMFRENGRNSRSYLNEIAQSWKRFVLSLKVYFSVSYIFRATLIIFVLLVLSSGALKLRKYSSPDSIDSSMIPSPIGDENVLPNSNESIDDFKYEEAVPTESPMIVKRDTLGKVEVNLPNTSAQPNKNQKADKHKQDEDLLNEPKSCLDEPKMAIKFDKIGDPLFINECDTE